MRDTFRCLWAFFGRQRFETPFGAELTLSGIRLHAWYLSVFAGPFGRQRFVPFMRNTFWVFVGPFGGQRFENHFGVEWPFRVLFPA